MKKTLSFNQYFENPALTKNICYSKTIVESIARSLLEPVAQENSKALIFLRLKNIEGTKSLIKRLEYAANIELKEFSDFEFSKFDIEETGIVLINSHRYNCAFLFREIEKDKYEIYLKINSKLVNRVYETIKSAFLADYDDKFYVFKPERRENDLMNSAVCNILKYYEETIEEGEYNSKIRENYRAINETNTTFRNEIYQNAKQIAHEIKNQLSILDIYTRIFEKKTGDTEVTEPIKKSVRLIKSQIEKFKDIDVINLQERNIKAIIQESIKIYSGVLREKNNRLVLIDEMAGREASAFLDEDKFLIVINNIIKNANDSTQDDEITVKLSEENEKIKISITNHGQMIEKANQSKIFTGGYTTKKDGWGIGLSVCKKFIGSQFGTFELTKSDEKETIFTLTLPLAQTR